MLVNIPGETIQDLTNVYSLVNKLRPSVVSVNLFQPYLGTELKGDMPNKEIITFAEKMNKHFNSLWNALYFHLSLRYIKMFLMSKRKDDYFKQLGNLIKEAMQYV